MKKKWKGFLHPTNQKDHNDHSCGMTMTLLFKSHNCRLATEIFNLKVFVTLLLDGGPTCAQCRRCCVPCRMPAPMVAVAVRGLSLDKRDVEAMFEAMAVGENSSADLPPSCSSLWLHQILPTRSFFTFLSLA
jgi:hypothetical protein